MHTSEKLDELRVAIITKSTYRFHSLALWKFRTG